MSESLEQQTATSEILRVISSSPTDIQPVFEAIAERAMQLCHASSSGVLRFDGKVVHIVALGNVNPDRAAALRSAFPMAPNTRSASTRAILTCSVVHIPDVLEDPEYGIATQAQAGGFRSVLSVPMLRERKAIGGVTVGRPTSGRFSESQVALLQTFESIEALTRDGILWLGTLHGFRNAEGKMISDKEEGKLTLTEEIFDYTVNTKGAVLTRRVFGDPSPNKIVHGNRITEARETHDLWCYCTSHSLKSLAEVQEWTPTYNACAVIHRPKDFMVLIANALEPLHPLRTVGIYPIVYRKREYEYAQHDGTDPALIKAPFFSSQDEIRFIFESWERPQRAIRLHIPELVSCCRILQDDEIPK